MGRLAVVLAVATSAAVVVGRMVKRWLSLRKARHLVKEFEKGCATSVGRLRRLVEDMVVSMQTGLDDEGSRMMVPTLLHVLPDGTEDGIYYTLHLDARSLDSMSCIAVRIELVNRDFQPVGLTSVKSTEEKMIPRNVLTGTSEVSKDVSTSLKEAMARIGLNMRVAALVNHPEGTLALGHYDDTNTVAAVQIGTDTKACYIEQIVAIRQWPDFLNNSEMQVYHMITNSAKPSVGRLRRLVEDDCMVPTLLHVLHDGTKDGIYYTLHLDARSLDSMSCRAVRIELVNSDIQPVGLTSVKGTEEKMIPRDVLTGTSENFFDFIARELQKFVQNMGNDSNLGMKLGFAWPFSIKRVSHSGRLFEGPNIFALGDVSKDVSTSLKEAMARIGLNMRVAALVNHPEGTLALGHYDDTDAVAAVQIGTDTKACYIEQIGAIRQWRDILNNSDASLPHDNQLSQALEAKNYQKHFRCRARK